MAEYVTARATQPDAVLSQLIERTRAETGGAAGMQVSASQGALLTLLARVGGARRGWRSRMPNRPACGGSSCPRSPGSCRLTGFSSRTNCG